MMRITVGHDGEDYATIQEAINAVPYHAAAEIEIHSGIYREKLFSEKEDISIRGIGDVSIIWDDGAAEILDDGRKRGTFRSYTAFFSGNHLVLDNISIINACGSGRTAGQGIALYLDAAEAEITSVSLRAHQDTLFLSPLPREEREAGGFYGPRHLVPRRKCRSTFCKCLIEGDVDFIFGGGDALFEDCEIRSIGPGYVAAPSTDTDGTGFVFNRCAFTSEHAENGSVFLMRPWRKHGKAVFVSSSFGSHIAGSGMCPWPGLEDEANLCTFLLSGCSFQGNADIDSSHMISEEEAGRIMEAFRC